MENGGGVTNTYGHVGYDSGSSGTAMVTGAGSSWANSGWLDVGQPVTADILVAVLVTWPVPWGQPKKTQRPEQLPLP